MKLIGLDVGTKRIGVAKADSSVRIAIPYSAVEVDGGEFKKIASLARAWDINSFVLGLPRNSSGEETAQSRYVRKFAKELKAAIPNAKICFQDESLTSVEAEGRLKNRKKGYKKGDIDSEAATIILQDFLEEKTGKKTVTRAASAKRKTVTAVKPHRLATAIITTIILLVVAGAGAYGYYLYCLHPVTDVDCSNTAADACDKVNFTVESGSSIANVASSLKEQNLIRNSLAFQIYFRLNSDGESLKAGTYELNQAMSTSEIATALLTGSRDNVFSFTIPPGENLFTIRKKLLEIGYTDAEIDAAYAADYSGKQFAWLLEDRPEGATLEGYIYGDTYEFYKDDTVEKILDRAMTELADVVEENDLKAKFAAHGLSLYQGITLASIVQKEANQPETQAQVAQVFYNRLASNMSLGSDVTFKYALDLIDPERQTYTNADANTLDHPYNTRNPNLIGLPFGPISNPGLSALNAVATPDESMSDMLFFLTGDDGLMYYSSTDEGHAQNIRDHCQVICNVAL